MREAPTLIDCLAARGVSRRDFLKFCATLTSLMALPPAMAPAVAQALAKARRPSVIWLSFQECTGCTESLTRTSAPTLENLIFDVISLDYHETLQAAAGFQAEEAKEQAMKEAYGKYLLLVDNLGELEGSPWAASGSDSFRRRCVSCPVPCPRQKVRKQGQPELLVPTGLLMSGRLDSNQRPPEPHSGALAKLRHAPSVS